MNKNITLVVLLLLVVGEGVIIQRWKTIAATWQDTANNWRAIADRCDSP